MKEGDENSKFFHSVVNWRRRMNSLNGLNIDGEWVEDPLVVKETAKRFFTDRFKEMEVNCGMSFDGVQLR